MGRFTKAKGIHGDTPSTNQTEADLSCPLYNYIAGIYVNTSQVLAVGGTPAKGGGDPTKNTINSNVIPLAQVTKQPEPDESINVNSIPTPEVTTSLNPNVSFS